MSSAWHGARWSVAAAWYGGEPSCDMQGLIVLKNARGLSFFLSFMGPAEDGMMVQAAVS